MEFFWKLISKLFIKSPEQRKFFYKAISRAGVKKYLELNDFPIENVTVSENKTTYIINSNYNEMELLNDVKVPLNNKCDYFTVTWNIYSYF